MRSWSANRGRQSNFLRPKTSAGGQNDIAFGNVLAGKGDGWRPA